MSNSPTNLNLPSHVPPHYLIEVEGTLWDKGTDGEKVSKGYTMSIPVPTKAKAEIYTKRYNAETHRHEEVLEVRDISINEYGIRSYLKKTGVLKDKLQKKLNPDGTPQFINITHVRTIIITNVVASHPGVELPNDPAALNLTQLKTLVKTMGWQIDLQFFNTVHLLREALTNYKEDPKGYEAYEVRMKKVKGKQSAFTSAANELDAYYESQTALQEASGQRGVNEQLGEGTKRVKSLKQPAANKTDNITDEI